MQTLSVVWILVAFLAVAFAAVNSKDQAKYNLYLASGIAAYLLSILVPLIPR